MTGHTPRYATLDGIRGIAAAAVLLFHGGLLMGSPWMVGHGALAVDVFFAMSGFVVERAYGTRLRAGWSREAFAAARLVRLYPLYLVGTLLGLALQLCLSASPGRPVELGGLALATLAGAFLIPLFRGGDRQMFPLDAPCWSLLIEVLANAGFAAMPRWREGLLAAGVVAAAASLLAAGLGGVPLLLGGTSEHMWVDVTRGAFGFGSGMLISRAEARGGLDGLRGRRTAPAMLALLGLMLVPRGPADTWLDPLAILMCPAVVALAIVQARPSERLSRLCAGAGALSYPLYILHAPLLKLAADLTPKVGGAASAERCMAVWAAMGFSLALALAAARWLEPAMKWASRRGAAPGRRPSLAAEASD